LWAPVVPVVLVPVTVMQEVTAILLMQPWSKVAEAVVELTPLVVRVEHL
jgi:hypothetical protein